MHDILFVTSFSIAFSLLIIGLLVAIKNYRSYLNISFLFFCIFTAIWVTSNFISNDNSLDRSELRLANHTVLAAGAFTLAALLFFTSSLSKARFSNLMKILFIFNIICGILSFTPLIIDDIEKSKNVVSIEFGPLSYLYFICLILAIIYSVGNLLNKYLSSKGQERKKIRTIIIAIIITTFIALLANILAPMLGYFELTNFGAFSSIILAIGMAYAIIKDQIFDIHYYIWRLIAYIVFLVTIGVILSTIIAVGFFLIFTENNLSLAELIYITFSLITMIIIYEPIKKYIKYLTSKFLFQQDYSVQSSLKEISLHASKSTDPRYIQRKSLKTFEDSIKQTFGMFIFKDDNKQFVLGEKKGLPPQAFHSLDILLEILSNQNNRLTTLTDLKDYSTVKKVFELYSIGAIVALKTNSRLIGFIILGEKKNGHPYSFEDREFATVAANEIAIALENAQRYEEIQLFNTTLQEKVNSATKALKRTNAKLVALDDAKDEFISMASHQLRTPLTSVKGYISMLLEEDLGKLNKTQKQALKEAFDSSQRMVFLISDFLNVSRIRTGKFLIEASNMNMPEVIEQEIAQLRDMAAYKEQLISYNAPINFPAVQLDENKIRQVMMNMIDNAIYYTPKGGQIEIILEKTTEEIIFKVIDSGIGVPAKEQHRLFTKFFRAKNARQARPDGTGLGLFMAQKIITAQGGSIIFKSTENNGSTFGFRFPLEKVVVDEKVTQRV
jgi:signal transduction histidine kinase